jgi:4-hydroxy-L-threonine phosphate dehydrogenase PdxA
MPSKKKDFKPKMAITMGDPRGVGPEIVAKAFARAAPHDFCAPLVLGDVEILSRTVQRMALGLRVAEVGEEGLPGMPAGVLPVLPVSNLSPGREPGEIPPAESSRASFAYVERAGRMAMEGKVEAIVTAPVSKEAIHGAGIAFRGHTEYLAEISGTRDFVMMLAGERLKVTLVTTHVPLEAVAKLLTDEKIFSVIEITAKGLQEYFELRPPRLAVAGLNPHAGEGGLFGNEEVIISRAVQRARDRGLSVSAVNVTLGLPFVRTSVDHGVAYDIAGKGLANSRSMEEAIRLGARMAGRTKEKDLWGRR